MKIKLNAMITQDKGIQKFKEFEYRNILILPDCEELPCRVTVPLHYEAPDDMILRDTPAELVVKLKNNYPTLVLTLVDDLIPKE